ncbi:DNA-processing protein DprA [Limibacillus sp. MBR-115]|jgi:DNA processing protein|uniref:DNA-processing protein DprA n=1 Tax=Limibacillus sp. MBR-115 TaxID=3156465 RepID=UPI003392FB2F
MTGRRSLSQQERLEWLRLIRSENVGPVTFKQLLQKFGSANRALERLPELARRGGRRKPIRVPTGGEIAKEADRLVKLGGCLLCSCEPDYPAPLVAIDDAPPVLSLLGHPHLLARPAVAVVGARNASINGRRLARDVSAGLAEAGYLVVSGMARGIDTAAHEAALPIGTAAVVAGGVDIVYPEENRPLYENICQNGVVLAEQPFGTEPQARHFPRRNRIVSGLSLGVLIVEAAPRSGSLITARFALEQGREVFAVPGSPLDPRARGANALLKQGAVVTENAEDILVVLSKISDVPLAEPTGSDFQPGIPSEPDEPLLENARSELLLLLSPTPVAVDELLRECQFSPSVVATVLLELELAGRLERHPGNRISLIA